ncbi:MAG: hypothetical protein IK066_12725 [Kiritimatiellae bacterium]|nr:hypothetical protein [Kiritimatiellia bacterium]
MKTIKTVSAAVAAGLLAAGMAAAEEHEFVSIDEMSSTNADNVVLGWDVELGGTYRVLEKASLTDTNDWKPRSNTLRADMEGMLQQALEVTDDVLFFRVEKVDVSGPSFQFLSPAKDAVSVDPAAPVSVAISDPSGVDTNSVFLYVGDAVHRIGDPRMEWEDGVLTWTGGLGAAGEEVEVWATAKDSKGNPASSESSRLTLASELAAVASEDGTTVPFVVIGNGAANVSDLVETVAAATRGTLSAKARAVGGTIRIQSAPEGALVFGYTGEGWKLLAVGQLWASQDPENIFYRRIVEVGTPDGGTITATTEEATLADFFDGGSFNGDEMEWSESDIVDLAEGEEAGPTSRRRLVRPRIGGSTSKTFATNGVLGASWLNAKIPANVPLRFVGRSGCDDTGKELGEWDVTAGFGVGADFAVLKRKFNTCDLSVTGKVHVYLHPRLEATTNAAYSNTWSKTIANVKKTFGGTIGPVPIWVDIGVEVPVTLTVQAQATNASVAAEIDISRSLDFRWHLSDDQWRQLGSGNPGWVIAKTNFNYTVEGSAGVRAAIQPTLTIKVYSLVGAYGWVEPYLEANAVGRVQGHNLQAPDFYYLLTAYAGLNAEIGLASTIWCDSWGDPPHKTFSPLRKELLHLEGTNTPPSFVSVPQDYTAEAGETVMLSALAKGTAPLRYKWFRNGVDTGRRESYITLTAGDKTEGVYRVQVSNGYGTNSATATLALATNTPEVSVVGTWRFRYQWNGHAANSYAARIYSDGSMHDTSPLDSWWDWHVNGMTVRFETREKWEDGQSAVYRGRFLDDTMKYMSGTMVSPSGEAGRWSMQFFSADPDASIANMRAIRAAGADGEEWAEEDGLLPSLDPAGRAW